MLKPRRSLLASAFLAVLVLTIAATAAASLVPAEGSPAAAHSKMPARQNSSSIHSHRKSAPSKKPSRAQRKHVLKLHRNPEGRFLASAAQPKTPSPKIVLVAVPPATTTSDSATISFETADAAKTTCRLDSLAETVCSSSITYRQLPIGNHTATVTVAKGNTSVSATANWTVLSAPAGAPTSGTTTTSPPAPTVSSSTTSPYAVRGIYQMGVVTLDATSSTGLNTFKVSADDAQLISSISARGLKAWAEPGFYLNSTCSFSWSDDRVRQAVQSISATSAIIGYYIADEPDVTVCPNAPRQLAARSVLIHSVDPGSETVIANWHQLTAFANSADAFALDMYPCSISWYSGCALNYVSSIASEADRLGIKYYGVIQAFGDPWGFTMPNAAQLHDVFTSWRSTKMSGYFVFAWDWPLSDPAYWLINHPAVLDQLKYENAH